jgi:hypothetical protein
LAHKQHGPLRGASGPGLDDFLRAADKSGPEVPQTLHLKQAAQQRLRRQRMVARIHSLGARVTFELLDELIRAYPYLAADIDERLERYAGLDPTLLRALGADRFATAPVRVVGGRP